MSRDSRTIYVGNLPGDVRRREVDDLFYKYGKIVEIEVKVPPRPPGFAFVEFADRRDAEDAVKGRDGYSFSGARLRVEIAKSRVPGGGRDDHRGGRDDFRGGGGYGGGGGGGGG
eukprot:CAMPEP_0118929836 /NCGR_PEP_ID=MMETSP1169-20130426/6720_1 /TAXON_ID=36882 /ORGANISM="Pyramimonas obovata, Strain CCMP722" /LENGTH=113 /DNA_ID=CAMNT_0006872095 /DNA_START=160 /DNA_END=497 /DNA_ORIENTATION=-